MLVVVFSWDTRASSSKKFAFFFLLASYLRSSIHAERLAKGKKDTIDQPFGRRQRSRARIHSQPILHASNVMCIMSQEWLFSSHSSSTPDIIKWKIPTQVFGLSIDYFTSSTRKIIIVFRYSWTEFNNIYIFFWSCVITWHDWPTCTWFAFIVVIKSIVQSCYSFHKKRT